MINFVSVLVSEKNKISVHKEAFIDVINSLTKTIEGIQINASKTNAIVALDGKGIKLYLEVKIVKGIKIQNKILEIKKSLENHTLYLIDSKPSNIVINYVGRI